MKKLKDKIKRLKLDNKGMTIEMVVFTSMLVLMFLFIISYATLRIGMIKRYTINEVDKKIEVEEYGERYLKSLNDNEYIFDIDEENNDYIIELSNDSNKYIKVYDKNNILILEVNYLYNSELNRYYINSWKYRG